MTETNSLCSEYVLTCLVSIDARNVLRVTYFLLSGMARKTLYYSASSYHMFLCVTQTHQFCVSLSLGSVQDLQSMVVFCW